MQGRALSDRPLLHAGAAEDFGVAMEPVDSTCAVAQLNQAFDMYSAHGAVADARRVARALQGLGVHRRVVRKRERSGWESLTASEMRVLELVADGATNRGVAQRLTISPHTVNTHLRNIFSKVGVHSRGELATLMRGRAR